MQICVVQLQYVLQSFAQGFFKRYLHCQDC